MNLVGVTASGRGRLLSGGLAGLAIAMGLSSGSAAQQGTGDATATGAAAPVVATPSAPATPAAAADGGSTATVEVEPPARRATLSFNQGVSLRRAGGGIVARATTDLGLNVALETPISSLSFAAATGIDLTLPLGDSDASADVSRPGLSLAYERAVPSASLTVRARYRSSPISGFSSLDDIDFFDLPTDFVLPDDLNELIGDGTRSVIVASARLTLRDDRPLRFIFDVGLDDTLYTGVIVPELVSNREVTARATAVGRVTPVLEVSTGVGWSRRSVDGAADVDTTSLTFGAELARPLGAITANLSFAADDEGDPRPTLSIGRTLETPTLRLSARLGVTTSDAGDAFVTARLDASRDLPNGEVGATLTRGLATDAAGLDREATSLTARYRREINPTTALSVVALYDTRSETALTAASSLAEIGATVSRELTPDWSLDLGYVHSLRDADDGTDASQSGELRLSVGRTFEFGL